MTRVDSKPPLVATGVADQPKAPVEQRREEPPPPLVMAPLQSGAKKTDAAAKVALPPPGPKTVATLHNVTGAVRVRPPGGDWRPAKEGDQVGENWNVSTSEGGHVDVSFDDNSKTVLPENSLLVIYTQKKPLNAGPLPEVQMDRDELKKGLAALRGETPKPTPK